MKKTTLVAACAFAALAPAARLFAEENAEASELEHLEETQERRWLRFSAQRRQLRRLTSRT